MILVGSQRGGARDLALHLMKDDNERVIVHEIRGFAAQNLMEAFQNSHAISKGTKCRQHLYSLSLNPPGEAEVPAAVFEDAIARAEERLGLTGQPRAIVFHEKIGGDGQMRRHAHAVWSRIDGECMTAIPMSFDRPKLQELARELYLENDWQMPRGFLRHDEADPRNYTLAQWQQAKRAKTDPAKLKEMFQDCWAISDSQAAFAGALRERGYILARGDRRGVVAVDRAGEVYAIARWAGIKAKQVRARITDEGGLPSVTSAHVEAATGMADRLKELKAAYREAAKADLQSFLDHRRQIFAAQKAESRALSQR
ncbi:MAG: relaxase [Pseudomonadota bacterium]